jgi:hypothetical protein
MRKLISLVTAISVLALAGCGSDKTLSGGNTGGGTNPGGAPVAGVTVLASSPSLPSDQGQTVNIQAIVRDANNVAMDGVTVIMSSDSGTLTFTNPVTDQSGIVNATLSAGGDPTPRAITVTADAQGVTASVSVNVTGTRLSISGPASLPQGDSATFTVVLLDAGGNGISGQTVDVTSGNGNTLSAASLTTDSTGQAQVTVTAAAGGLDTLTATALGISATADLDVSSDSFSISAPVSGDQIILNTATPVTATWVVGGTPQAGQTISFSATRGVLSATTAITDGTGTATVSIQSTNAGPSQITATNPNNTSTSVDVQFIADTPATIDMQASPFTLGPQEQSLITAIVRDAAGNLVTGANIVFELQDVTGGRLLSAAATTDANGQATTTYEASSTTSAIDGVVITGTVQGTAIANSVALTVAQREVFISIGTGNELFEPNSAQYRKEFIVQVTDAQGIGVEGVTVQVGILSDNYYKGFWQFDFLATTWVRVQTAGPCADEDTNRNGQLDFFPNVPMDEDVNLSGRIEAGNIATAVSQTSGTGTFVTGTGGFGVVDVYYPQDHATWVDVTLEAKTSVQGTETASASSFRLDILAEDVADENVTPPGDVSPFGLSGSCLDTN